MEVVEEERSFGSQIHLWSMLGPFFAVLGASLVTIAKFPGYQLFFWASLVSIIVCCRWKLVGFTVTSSALLALIFYNYYHARISEHIWYLSVNFSVLLSLLITSLSYKEIQSYFEELAEEGLMTSTSEELADLKNQLETLKETYNATLENKNTLENQLRLMQDDLEKQLEQKKVESQSLQNQLAALEEKTAKIELLEGLEEQLREKEQEFFNLNFRLASAEEDLKKSQLERQDLKVAYQRLKEDCEAKAELEGRVQEAELTHQSMIQELNDHIETVDMEKNLLEKTLACLQLEYERLQEQEHSLKEEINQLQAALPQKEAEVSQVIADLERQLHYYKELVEQNKTLKSKGLDADLGRIASTPPSTELKAVTLYQQLREQFAEKSFVLDETRKELFRANEQVLLYQKKEEEKNYSWSELEENLYRCCEILAYENEEMEKKHREEVEILESLVSKFSHV